MGRAGEPVNEFGSSAGFSGQMLQNHNESLRDNTSPGISFAATAKKNGLDFPP
jgi:hypothetical protein